MKISVLLPTKNAAATLPEALSSLRAQMTPAHECVVVDDGSTDSTQAVLSEAGRDWPALRVFRTSGMGIARALNLGLAHCSSEWIARMDADDRCDAARFERQLALAATDPRLALVSCEVRHWVRDAGAAPEQFEGMLRHIEWANAKHSHDELEQALWIDSPLPHPTWLVHRRAFDAVGHYDTSRDLPEDYEWLHRFFAAARSRADLRAGKCAAPALVDWADSGARLTRTDPAYSQEAFNEVKARMLKLRLEALGTKPELFIFGLGPKAKALVPMLTELRVRAIVDVHPRRAGIVYQGLEVWDVDTWQEHLAKPGAAPAFVLNCVGTAAARELCEELCRVHGLAAGTGYLSL